MSKKIDRTGEESYNNFGSKIVIVGYRNNTDVDIYFPDYDWTAYHVQYNKFTHGNIKCPYEPRVVNMGYIGEGKYKSIISNGSKTQTHCYSTWRSMLTRCYDEKYHIKKSTYENCYVCDEWLNFQNFAEWYYQNYYEIDGEIMNLDKDILIKGNNIYSPESCIFVPQCINDIFCLNDANRGKLPIGVHMHKCGKYVSMCNNGNGVQEYLGMYDTIEEAFIAYKNYKEKVVREIAKEYFNKIPLELYEILINYNVEIND